jgi:hypothetical protein
MSYELSWQQENVIVLHLEGLITLKEIESFSREIAGHLDTGEPPVYLIIDAFEIRDFPRNVISLNAATLPLFGHPALSWVAIVLQDRIAQYLATLVGQISGNRLATFRTRAEADAFIEKQRSVIGHAAV